MLELRLSEEALSDKKREKEEKEIQKLKTKM
jgi:hypothetical protein